MYLLAMLLLLLYWKADAKIASTYSREEETSLFVSIAVLDPHIPDRLMIGKDVAVTVAMHLAPDYTPKEVHFNYKYNGSMDLPVGWVEFKGFAPTGDGWAEVTVKFDEDVIIHQASAMIANTSHGDVHYDFEMDNHSVFLKIRMVLMAAMENKDSEANSHEVSLSMENQCNGTIKIEKRNEGELPGNEVRSAIPSSSHTGNASFERVERKMQGKELSHNSQFDALQNVTRKKKDPYVEAVVELLHEQKHEFSWKFLVIYAIVSSTFLLMVLSITILLLFFCIRSCDSNLEIPYTRAKPARPRHRPIEV